MMGKRTVREEFKRREAKVYDSLSAAIQASIMLINTEHAHLYARSGSSFICWPIQPEHIQNEPNQFDTIKRVQLEEVYGPIEVKYRDENGKIKMLNPMKIWFNDKNRRDYEKIRPVWKTNLRSSKPIFRLCHYTRPRGRSKELATISQAFD